VGTNILINQKRIFTTFIWILNIFQKMHLLLTIFIEKKVSSHLKKTQEPLNCVKDLSILKYEPYVTLFKNSKNQI